MSVIVTGTIPKALKPGVKTFWGSYTEDDLLAAKLLKMETTDEQFDEDVLVSPFGLLTAKNEGAGVDYDSMTQGYVTRYQQRTRALGYQVSWEARKFGKYLNVVSKGNEFLSASLRETKEVDVADLFNNGFDTNYTFGDGKKFFATDHPSRAGNFSNTLATPQDLCEEALEELCVQIKETNNDRGIKARIKPVLLQVPSALMFEATRILESQLRVNTANNDINALKNMGLFSQGIVVNPHLESNDAYFIKTDAPEGAKMITAVQGEFSNDGAFESGDHKYKIMTSYSIGVTDPRGYFASEGV
jgi:hypothetical protein|tara:strand:- start:8319 stop:9224 length:906 start_codon:yes stop_codon:yes gene_type:complete